MGIISRLLSEGNVVLGLPAIDRKGALEEIALLVGRRHHIDHTPIFRALWRREQSGSTALGHGFAIPHARIPGIREPIVLFVRTQPPIEFGAPDHRPVSALFVILVPEDANEEHLQILATVSEMLSSSRFRSRLEAAKDPAAIQRLFGEWASDSGPSVK
ncbi:MAG TPA: PTS sugar transporter subunit IIA [Burkholderiales bacterium]|nr:PTS sugar transporter subunit IIA [Burkholderiales bacterium]